MPRIVEDALLVYTDGSLYPKGRKGGYGIVFIHVDQIGQETVVSEHAPPGVVGTTGNRMELQACIDALKLAPQIGCFGAVNKLVVRTDSRYITSNYLNALGNWRRLRWHNSSGRPVDNADLWKAFATAHGKIRKRLLFEWVKGHGKGTAKDRHNYRADTLAKDSAKSSVRQSIHRSSVRRKFAPAYTKRGSVRLLGQTLLVYIIEVLRLRVQKTWKYRYQVVSQDSPDRHAIDWIYSSEHMRDGHFYEVQVNDDMRHPRVLALLREVDRKDLSL
jgi:ribonuclease HI